MSEHWAFCERCHRWYYADRASLQTGHVRCPVCEGAPVIVRSRTVDPAILTS